MRHLVNLPDSVAVREFHLDRADDDAREQLQGLAGYTNAFIILRYRNTVVGQLFLPIRQGELSLSEIRQHATSAAWPIWQLYVNPSPTSPLPTASVVVCTRNRTDDLRRCLPTLAPLTAQGYEVIVVDNCPDDDRTEQLVATYPSIRYIYEARPGLDVARNRGLRTATGEIVAFIDDDAQADPGWLQALLRNFDDPMVAVVTGLTLPLELETKAQVWFEATNGFGRGFVRKTFDLTITNPLGAGVVGAGANMAIRRRALADIGFFNELLDGGTPTLSGGDQEFFYRALARGYRIVYEPAAVVRHKHRHEWKALRHTLYGYGVGLFAWWTHVLLVEKEYSLLVTAIRWFVQHHVWELLRSLMRRPGSTPLDLAWSEFVGALAGPWRYLQARRRARHHEQKGTLNHSRPASSLW